MRQFWMVAGPEQAPYVRHKTRQSADQEAARLARKHHGSHFAVLESVASVVVNDLQWNDHRDLPQMSSDVPF